MNNLSFINIQVSNTNLNWKAFQKANSYRKLIIVQQKAKKTTTNFEISPEPKEWNKDSNLQLTMLNASFLTNNIIQSARLHALVCFVIFLIRNN